MNTRSMLLGALVGDALGVPFEFKSRDTFLCEGMVGHGTYGKPEGTWSDDGAMLLATWDSLQANDGRVVAFDMQRKFRAWFNDGAYTTDGDVFDVGGTTAVALRDGKGLSGEHNNGNGSLMRIAPLAAFDCSDEDIETVSAITHAHRVSKHACVNFVHLCRALAQGTPLQEALETMPHLYGYFAKLLESPTRPRDEIKSSGYVLHTLDAAIWCLANSSSYAECVLKAVNLGDDTDTTACVAGALAGIVYPDDPDLAAWSERLQNRDLLVELGIW